MECDVGDGDLDEAPDRKNELIVVASLTRFGKLVIAYPPAGPFSRTPKIEPIENAIDFVNPPSKVGILVKFCGHIGE